MIATNRGPVSRMVRSKPAATRATTGRDSAGVRRSGEAVGLRRRTSSCPETVPVKRQQQ